MMRQFVFAATDAEFRTWVKQNGTKNMATRVIHPFQLAGVQIDGVTNQIVILRGWIPPGDWNWPETMSYLQSCVRSTGEINHDTAILRV